MEGKSEVAGGGVGDREENNQTDHEAEGDSDENRRQADREAPVVVSGEPAGTPAALAGPPLSLILLSRALLLILFLILF